MKNSAGLATESVRVIGDVMLFCSGALWLLYLANVRARMHFAGPDMSFLVWPALYTTFVGIGLAFLKKWAAVLSFVGCVLIGSAWLLIIASREFNLLWLLSGAAYAAFLYLVGMVPLRHWQELK